VLGRSIGGVVVVGGVVVGGAVVGSAVGGVIVGGVVVGGVVVGDSVLGDLDVDALVAPGDGDAFGAVDEHEATSKLTRTGTRMVWRAVRSVLGRRRSVATLIRGL
jgi:hypothetical protein